MSVVAILGAGPIGSASAESLARRARVRGVRLVDAESQVAAGKALDLRQSGPVNGVGTDVTSAGDPLSAVGASVIVIADRVNGGEWMGDEGLALIDTLSRAGSQAPIVFAGPSQTPLLEECARRLKLPAHRLVGSAASAIVATAKGLAGMELGLSFVELTVAGRPPAFVIGWSSASVAGSLLIDRVPAHRLMAISQALPRFWPPGPYAVGTATALIAEALIFGSRRLHPALSVSDHGFGPAGTAAIVPLQLGRLRVLSHVAPSLSPQERTSALAQTPR
jgi:hypothetical protein